MTLLCTSVETAVSEVNKLLRTGGVLTASLTMDLYVLNIVVPVPNKPYKWFLWTLSTMFTLLFSIQSSGAAGVKVEVAALGSRP